MILLAVYLAGCSLVIAILAAAIAIAEHYRAVRAEKALRMSLQSAWNELTDLRRADVELSQLVVKNAENINHVAALVSPPPRPRPTSQGFSVPGPRTAQ